MDALGLWALILVAVATTVALIFSLKLSILRPLDKTMKTIEAFGAGKRLEPLVPKTEAREKAFPRRLSKR